jgi:hypothetical protein
MSNPPFDNRPDNGNLPDKEIVRHESSVESPIMQEIQLNLNVSNNQEQT